LTAGFCVWRLSNTRPRTRTKSWLPYPVWLIVRVPHPRPRIRAFERRWKASSMRDAAWGRAMPKTYRGNTHNWPFAHKQDHTWGNRGSAVGVHEVGGHLHGAGSVVEGETVTGPYAGRPSKTRQREVPVAIAPDDADRIPRHRR